MELTENEKQERIARASDSFHEGQPILAKELPKDLHKAWAEYTFSDLTESHPEIKSKFYRLLTNDRCDIRHGILDPDILAYCCPLDNGHLANPEPGDPDPKALILGAFDVVPPEILTMMLVDFVHLKSLTVLRSVNRQFRLTIDKLPQYATIIEHAPASLRAALSLEVASSFTCRNLYTQLCSSQCFLCGKFGGFLNLVKCKRVCFYCFTEGAGNRVMTTEQTKLTWALTSAQLTANKLAVARSLPGRYGMGSVPKLARQRVTLIDHISAGIAAIFTHDSPESCADLLIAIDKRRNDRYDARKSEWQKSGADPKKQPKLPRYTVNFDRKEFEEKRYMCILPFPALSRSTNLVEWGVACTGCARINIEQNLSRWVVKDIMALSKILYSQRGYLEHFLVCKEAQKMFDDGYKSKIAGDTLVTPRKVCDFVPIQQDPHTRPYDDTCKERRGAGWRDLSSAERGKKLWENLKPKPRRHRVASSEDPSQAGEAAIQSGED